MPVCGLTNQLNDICLRLLQDRGIIREPAADSGNDLTSPICCTDVHSVSAISDFVDFCSA